MKLSRGLTRRVRKIQRLFYLYTSGLNHREIEQLLKKDTVDAFSYFKAKTKIADRSPRRSSVGTFFYMGKAIFFSFIMQLTPARRFFYGLGVAGFVIGLLKVDSLLMLGSFVVLNLLLALELVDKLTTRDELEIAREIQLNLQPLEIPDSRLLSIATFYRPARVVGGDFFDIVQPNGDRMISIVGDVSDKGISAALYAAYAQSMFQSFSQTSVSPTQIFQSLNELISKRLREGDFITAVIAFFDLNENSVTIARAGHNWPLFYCAKTQTIEELKPKGISIGLMDNELFSNQLEEKKIYLNQDDLLLLYSDGVTEAANSEKRMFETTGLKSVITECVHESSDNIISQIDSRLKKFVRSDELQDDATMVAFKVK
ncbi:MAG: PP2C family protein-serine/threonine phosphatase [Desulfobacteraceae bacterium]|jgi:sigma-B regulation protein RsbU (phosphoserine phosphatase)|nr:PP2C family protein-serine/threonine phosphatase [Desulfobacteraceae bacterium]